MQYFLYRFHKKTFFKEKENIMKIKSIRVLSSAAAAVMALAVISGSLPTGFIGNNNDSYGITANAAIFLILFVLNCAIVTAPHTS